MSQTPPPDGRTAKWILLLTLLLMLLGRLASGAESPARKPLADVYQEAKRASVEVLVDGHLGGSGFFVDAEGLLVTAAHVVAPPTRPIEILSPVAGRIEADVVAVDLGHDLVLLRAKPRQDGYPALPLAEELPSPGDDVFLLGAPLYRHAVMLRGMVARDDTAFEFYTGHYVEAVHVACTVQNGMSGGLWINHGGQVVGLQSGVISMNSIPIGVASMIPCTAIRTLLKNGRSAATPTIGAAIEELWQHGADVLGRFPPRTEGLVFRTIEKDGPAGRAGLKEWDAIIAADGQKVRLSGDLLRIVRAKQPGEELKLTILGPDGTGTREVTLRLGTLEVGWPGAE
ncbi:MAG TPA: trypsin-like peptidase domain-containing protein [Thermoguttaceae bacterium]|nr:trypsin-like peptidase domain-containing protein [Thermoguttaceae bacterium]